MVQSKYDAGTDLGVTERETKPSTYWIPECSSNGKVICTGNV